MAIVKVQRPLAGGTPDQPVRDQCLVYAQHKTLWSVQTVPDRVWEIIRGRRGGKAYFEATYDQERHAWTIGAQVGDRAW